MNNKSPLSLTACNCGLIVLTVLALLLLTATPALAGEDLYRRLSESSRSDDAILLRELLELGQEIDWSQAVTVEFEGNLRLLETEALADVGHPAGLYMVRELNGNLHILYLPGAAELQETESAVYYSNLNEMLGNKLAFKAQLAEASA